MPINVLLADDHAVIRDGLRALLEAEPDLVVVATAANGREALEAARRLQPDVAVMDISMPELNGIDASEQMRAANPGLQVIILSIHADREHIFRAFQAGARGYLLKESAGAEVVTAIRDVRAGRRYLSQRIADSVLDGYLSEHALAVRADPLTSLSSREREVLQLVAESHSTGDIASRLSLSPRTVETYRARLMAKLDLHDLPGLIKFALTHGLISLD